MTSNIFITKLPREITDNDLMGVFTSFNPVSATVMLDAATGKSKGFGFVLFPSNEVASEALRTLNGKTATVHHRNFHLVMQPSKHDGRISCTESNAIYIRNIPMTATRDEIQRFLSLYGTLVYSVMRQDNYGSPVWVIYAEYDCVDCAKKSLKMFHGNSSFFRPGLPILAKFADSNEIKEDRRRRRVDNSATSTIEEQALVDHNNDFHHNNDSQSSMTLTGSDCSSQEESRSNTPRVYRHNPYSASGASILVVCDPSVVKPPPVNTPAVDRKMTCPRVGPWIPLTEPCL